MYFVSYTVVRKKANAFHAGSREKARPETKRINLFNAMRCRIGCSLNNSLSMLLSTPFVLPCTCSGGAKAAANTKFRLS